MGLTQRGIDTERSSTCGLCHDLAVDRRERRRSDRPFTRVEVALVRIICGAALLVVLVLAFSDRTNDAIALAVVSACVVGLSVFAMTPFQRRQLLGRSKSGA
jgi:hypothetical protein